MAKNKCFWKGKKRPLHSKRMTGEGNPMYGKKRPDVSERNREYPPWHKGKTKDDDPRIAKLGSPGESNPMYGKHLTPWNKDKTAKEDSRILSGEKNPMYKMKHTKETIEKIKNSDYHINLGGKNSSNWKGGKSLEPYGVEFNNRLKERVREKYCRTCTICFITEQEMGKKLDVHHIDDDKRNNEINNLVTLCASCHMKVHRWKLEGSINLGCDKSHVPIHPSG